jgi:gliding motility-associated lipoprotein GldH
MGCDRPAAHVFVQEIPNGEWPRHQRYGGEFTVTDTLNPHHFFVTLRNTADYPYSNVYLFLHTEFPNGRKSKDTIECVLTDRYGRWLGSGNGFIFDHKIISNKVLYQYQKKFPLSGKYRIDIEHAMRMDTLKEILDVGVRIEKAGKQ